MTMILLIRLTMIMLELTNLRSQKTFSVDGCCSDPFLKKMKKGGVELGGPAPTASTGDEQTTSFCP